MFGPQRKSDLDQNIDRWRVREKSPLWINDLNLQLATVPLKVGATNEEHSSSEGG